MWIDTVQIDTEAVRLHLVWRIIFPLKWEIQEAEARFEVDPEAPLVGFHEAEQSESTTRAAPAAIRS